MTGDRLGADQNWTCHEKTPEKFPERSPGPPFERPGSATKSARQELAREPHANHGRGHCQKEVLVHDRSLLLPEARERAADHVEHPDTDCGCQGAHEEFLVH